jgi:hypothetical protein
VTRPAANPTLLYVPPTTGTTTRFRVVTPDHHPVAVTADPALAAATALAVARHHEAHYAAIAASDRRWLEVHLDGHTSLTPTTSDASGWAHLVERALARVAPRRPSAREPSPSRSTSTAT